jgi:hypothetical protein
MVTRSTRADRRSFDLSLIGIAQNSPEAPETAAG